MPGGKIREKCTTEVTDRVLCVGKWMGFRRQSLMGEYCNMGAFS